MLILVTVVVFFGMLGSSITALYVLMERSSARKRMGARLAAMQESSPHPPTELESNLIRQEVLSEIPALNRILAEIPAISRLQLFLRQAGLQIGAPALLLGSLILALFGFLLGWMASLPVLLLGLSALGAGMIPFLAVAFRRQQRFSKFEESFPDALDLLARAVRAGHAFTTGFELIADEMSEPLAGEFRITYDQQNLGLPMGEALHNLTERVPGGDVRLFVTALQIQRESGGNLGEILDNLSVVIRERFKLYRHIKTVTAEGRLSLYCLMVLPFAVGILMYANNPDYMTPLFEEELGNQLLQGAVVLQILGYFAIRKITSMKV
jgi:tight adherence protein B